MLRDVEMFGEMKRGLTMLQMRGSAHDKMIREFSIRRHTHGASVQERDWYSCQCSGAFVAQ